MPNKRTVRFFNGREALTFDDVLVQQGVANFYINEVAVAGRLSANITLPIPVVAAAMSSVVGKDMAVALAKQGGIASVPRSFAPEEQAKIVSRVKHHINGLLDDPIPAYATETVAEFLNRRQEHGWDFDSFVVYASKADETFVGLMTHSNFKRCDDFNAKIGAVMTKRADLKTAAPTITRREAYDLMRQFDKNVLPIIEGDEFKGIYLYSDLKRILTEKTNHNVDGQERLRVVAAIGVGDEALERAEALVNKGVDALHIDMAHGSQKIVAETIRRYKEKYPDGPDIIAGNVTTREGALFLKKAGTDAVVVGLGGGSICTTRVVTGVGRPQLAAVAECAHALEGSGIPVISDGGIRFSGDAVKALCAGASCTMVGNLLAGTDEAPGDKYLFQGVYYKDYYGMGSMRALTESAASRQRYLQQRGKALVPEGIEGRVPYKGPLRSVIEQYVGGLEKGFFDAGARSLEELHAKGAFEQVTNAGNRESHVHDVVMTSEPPNYSGRN